MINGIIAQKLQTLEEVLTELRSLGKIEAAQIKNDWRTQRAVERDLQVLVEIVIDVCQRLISVQGQTPALTGVDAVERCIEMGALSDKEFYRRMIRFRNFIVHRYERIDVNILVNMVNQKLTDFDQFKREILAYVQQD